MDATYESNSLIDRLPPHLKQFIKPQHYENYTPLNQAVWRYVMHKNVKYVSKVAHQSYVEGLKQTGVELDFIPSMYGMNRILEKIGWAAVAVDGFIPPHAFMEFQAYKILVIASDIRQLENIEYTPAPDIIHEAAGHAPIIANPDYAEYLRRLGEIGSKAILSKHDMELYEAVRKLSILKEAEGIKPPDIRKAHAEVERLQQQQIAFSELAQIRNLQWWTVEYGLIGALDKPKIYGAGLLSSIGESKWCLRPEVKKIPYSLAAAQVGFDITRPQPQLFVTPSFSHLIHVLEAFTNTMALRRGGTAGLQKLIDSGMIGTIELSSGLQISGCFSKMIVDNKQLSFFQTSGLTALAYRDRELIGHGIERYSEGFCSALGKLKDPKLELENMNPLELTKHGFQIGKPFLVEFESGLKVNALRLVNIFRNLHGKVMLFQLAACRMTYKNTVLFERGGIFDLAVGRTVISAFAGVADYNSFPNLYAASPTLTIQVKKTPKRQQLETYYQIIRTLREGNRSDEPQLKAIFKDLSLNYNTDWLLPLEILELACDEKFKTEITSYLTTMRDLNPALETLINEGLDMIKI